MDRNGLAFRYVTVLLCTAFLLSTVTPVSGDSEPRIRFVVVNGGQEVIVEGTVNVTVHLGGPVEGHNLTYMISDPTGHSVEDVIHLEQHTAAVHIEEYVHAYGHLPEHRRFELYLELVDPHGSVVDHHVVYFYAGVFELDLFMNSAVSAWSLTSAELLRILGEDVPINEVMIPVIYDSLSTLFVEDSVSVDVDVYVVRELVHGGTSTHSTRFTDLDVDSFNTLQVVFPLEQGPVSSTTVFVYGRVNEETKYGLGPLKLGLGGTSTYGTLSFEFPHTFNLQRTLSFQRRPFVMYSGEEVLRTSGGLPVYSQTPALYSYPTMFDEFSRWNSKVPLGHAPPLGDEHVYYGPTYDHRGWLRLLPQPMVVGYEHVYAPTDAEFRVIGGGLLPPVISVHVDGVPGSVYSVSRDAVLDNRATFFVDLPEGEYTFVLGNGTAALPLRLEQDVYLYSGIPAAITGVNARSSQHVNMELNVSLEIGEPGWGINTLDNSHNVDVEGDVLFLRDVEEVIAEPGESQGRQAPYGSLVSNTAGTALSHYRFAVCNVFRPYEFYAYVLLGDSEALGEHLYNTRTSEVNGTVRLSGGLHNSGEYHFRSLYGDHVPLVTYPNSQGLTSGEMDTLRSRGYQLFELYLEPPAFTVTTDRMVYGEGDMAVVSVDLDVSNEGVCFQSISVELEVYGSGLFMDAPVETLVFDLDPTGHGEVELVPSRDHEYLLVIDDTGYLFTGAFEVVPLPVRDTGSHIPLLRGAGLLVFIGIFLVIYKGMRSIYTDDPWSVSDFVDRFIRGDDGG